jgi:hypothetical protein
MHYLYLVSAMRAVSLLSILSFALLHFDSAFAGNWREISETDAQFPGQRQIIPAVYKIFKADAAALKAELFSAHPARRFMKAVR